MNYIDDAEYQKEHAKEPPMESPYYIQNNHNDGKPVAGPPQNNFNNINDNSNNNDSGANPYISSNNPNNNGWNNNTNQGNNPLNQKRQAFNPNNPNGNSYNQNNPNNYSYNSNNPYNNYNQYGPSGNPFNNNYPQAQNYPPGNNPFNQGYSPAPPAPSPSPVIIVRNNNGGSVCPICRQPSSMIGVHETSMTQWLWCFGIFLCFWPLCCVPFCMNKCDDIRYQCSQCRAVRSYYRAPCCP